MLEADRDFRSPALIRRGIEEYQLSGPKQTSRVGFVPEPEVIPRQSLLCGVPVTWNNLSAAMSGHKKSETIRQFTAHII